MIVLVYGVGIGGSLSGIHKFRWEIMISFPKLYLKFNNFFNLLMQTRQDFVISEDY